MKNTLFITSLLISTSFASAVTTIQLKEKPNEYKKVSTSTKENAKAILNDSNETLPIKLKGYMAVKNKVLLDYLLIESKNGKLLFNNTTQLQTIHSKNSTQPLKQFVKGGKECSINIPKNAFIKLSGCYKKGYITMKVESKNNKTNSIESFSMPITLDSSAESPIREIRKLVNIEAFQLAISRLQDQHIIGKELKKSSNATQIAYLFDSISNNHVVNFQGSINLFNDKGIFKCKYTNGLSEMNVDQIYDYHNNIINTQIPSIKRDLKEKVTTNYYQGLRALKKAGISKIQFKGTYANKKSNVHLSWTNKGQKYMHNFTINMPKTGKPISPMLIANSFSILNEVYEYQFS